MNFAECLVSSPVMLTEGAVVTRLVYEFRLPTPESAAFVHLYSAEGRAALSAIYRGYMSISTESGLPMQVGAPTWRAHPEALARLGFAAAGDLERVNADAVGFLLQLRREAGAENLTYVAGVVGPRVDGYDPHGAPDAAAAECYHRPQIQALAKAGADLLYAGTFAAVEELLGISRASAATRLPYILAPVIDGEGRLPDGSALADAVRRIDAGTGVPVRYAVCCVHPTHFATAMTTAAWPAPGRILGLQANASALPRHELEHLERADGSDPQVFAWLMAELNSRGMKVLGGCCGTGEAHIRALGSRLAASPASR